MWRHWLGVGPDSDVSVMEGEVFLMEPDRACGWRSAGTRDVQGLARSWSRWGNVADGLAEGFGLVTINSGNGVTLHGLDCASVAEVICFP